MSAHPFYDPETDGLVYHVVPDFQRAESISDIVSDTESSASGVTIASDVVPEYFVEHYGRQQPASENAVRWFPTDNTKQYILRHVLRKHLLGYNYAGPVGEMLSSDPGEGKKRHVLEIGTRDGTWVQEMATEFPHVEFRSLDVAPMTPHVPRPNVVFEVYDISEGLLLEDNSQDVVFITIAIELVKDYRALLLEVHRVLRPGGLIHLNEYIPGLWDSQDDTKPARRTNPIGCQVQDLIRSAISKLGIDPDMCEKLPSWLAPDSDLWKNTSQPRGFERIHTIAKTLPAYPHDNQPCSSKLDPRIAPWLAHSTVVSTRESVGLLRDNGLGAEEANSLIEAMIDELKDPERCPLFKTFVVYATKRG